MPAGNGPKAASGNGSICKSDGAKVLGRIVGFEGEGQTIIAMYGLKPDLTARRGAEITVLQVNDDLRAHKLDGAVLAAFERWLLQRGWRGNQSRICRLSRATILASSHHMDLHIRLLGDFTVTYGEQNVTSLNTARLQSLLAYFVLHRDAPQLRQHVAFLLWPDSAEPQARTNLRQLLHLLRRALPEADTFVHTDVHSIQWRADAPFTDDVTEFERLVSQAAHDPSPATHQQAVELYRGDLLPGCYDDWLLPERERLRQAFISTTEKLIDLLEAKGDFAAAIQSAQRLLRHDPLNEAAYRRLMRLHALSGDRAQALHAYHACATALQQELGVPPDAHTREMYEQLLNVDAAAAHPPQPALVGISPLVGREREMAQLLTAWQAATDGPAQFVCIKGEAGMGKSRLAEELLLWAGRQGIASAKTRCYEAASQLAYAPVADWLRSNVLRARMTNLDPVWLAEVARLLPELRTEYRDLPQPEGLDPDSHRQRLFTALTRAMLSPNQPLLLVVDDLQWCDRESLAWLNYLLHREDATRLLLVGTARSGEIGPDHPLASLLLSVRGAGRAVEIELGPLSAEETSIVAQHIAGHELTADELAHLLRETEGNPLFVVEAVRVRLERLEIGDSRLGAASQSPTSTPQSLPPRVQAVIQSRLAHLSPSARDLAGVAATIGREFTFDVLAQASQSDEDTLVRSLDELWQRRIIREQGVTTYDFSHDKIRDVAQAQSSAVKQKLLHRRVAQALETVYAADLDSVAGQIALHYERASQTEPAIVYYQRAAEVARRVYANAEIVSHLKRALALLASLPPSRERDERELATLTALGPPLVALKGYHGQDLMDTYNRASELGKRLGMPPHTPTMRGLAIASIVRRRPRHALELGEQLLTLALQDAVILVEGHYVVGAASFWLGQFVQSRRHLEQALAHFSASQRHIHIEKFAQDPQLVCLCRLAWTLWYLGYPDQANTAMQQVLALAATSAHPYSRMYASLYALCLYIDLRDEGAANDYARTVTALSAQHGFIVLFSLTEAALEAMTPETLRTANNPTYMHQGVDRLREMGLLFFMDYILAIRARVAIAMGQTKQAQVLVNEALDMVRETDQAFYEAELHRLKGEISLRMAAVADAEQSFQLALTIAQEQQAKSLELRAAMSLSRLWRAQGRHTDAHRLLADIYGWFTEGFDTPDLQDARALLAELEPAD